MLWGRSQAAGDPTADQGGTDLSAIRERIVTLHRPRSRSRGAAADRGVTAPLTIRTGSSEASSSLSLYYPLFFLGSSFFWLHNFALPNTFLGTPLVLDIEERRAIVRWKATTEAVITVPGIGRADGLKRPIRSERCARFTSVHCKP